MQSLALQVRNLKSLTDSLIAVGPLSESQERLLREVCGTENIIPTPVMELREYMDSVVKKSFKRGK